MNIVFIIIIIILKLHVTSSLVLNMFNLELNL